ncbi:MAG: transcription elongation factor GreA [Candidatus Moranbacteria bacterium]|nr:transcription elongation factor GreA [Candidatus Moranbacteria bacterium]
MSNLITLEGLNKFKKELEKCLERRIKLGKAIKSAKEHGDLSENADYSAAKAQQSENERRINWLRHTIEKSQVVAGGKKNKVDVGCIVKLCQSHSDKEISVCLVGVPETSPSEGKISHQSPLGKALMGKGKGEKTEVATPQGRKEYIIKDIK